MKHLLLSTLLLAGLTGCAKKDDPSAQLPANTFRFTVQGKQVSVPAGGATMTLSNQNRQWNLVAQANDATQTNLTIWVYSASNTVDKTASIAAGQPGQADPDVTSVYQVLVLADFVNSCGQTIYKNGGITYQTFTTPTPSFTFTITAINTQNHTVSGTFAGDYWKGCDKLPITGGEFSLPYTVKL